MVHCAFALDESMSICEKLQHTCVSGKGANRVLRSNGFRPSNDSTAWGMLVDESAAMASFWFARGAMPVSV